MRAQGQGSAYPPAYNFPHHIRQVQPTCFRLEMDWKPGPKVAFARQAPSGRCGRRSNYIREHFRTEPQPGAGDESRHPNQTMSAIVIMINDATCQHFLPRELIDSEISRFWSCGSRETGRTKGGCSITAASHRPEVQRQSTFDSRLCCFCVVAHSRPCRTLQPLTPSGSLQTQTLCDAAILTMAPLSGCIPSIIIGISTFI